MQCGVLRLESVALQPIRQMLVGGAQWGIVGSVGRGAPNIEGNAGSVSMWASSYLVPQSREE
jgi:hypothetical protein